VLLLLLLLLLLLHRPLPLPPPPPRTASLLVVVLVVLLHQAWRLSPLSCQPLLRPQVLPQLPQCPCLLQQHHLVQVLGSQ
jgi:hypothetical protein